MSDIPGDRAQQVRTVTISIFTIMRGTAFRQGVADVRSGRAPRFDGEEFVIMPMEREPPGDPNSFINRQWNYERGRHFGTLAPRSLPVVMPRAKRLNPEAVKFYADHFLESSL
jgi:hypothetical protein